MGMGQGAQQAERWLQVIAWQWGVGWAWDLQEGAAVRAQVIPRQPCSGSFDLSSGF